MANGITFFQMTAATLNAIKGFPDVNALDYVATFDPTLANVLVLPGMVLSLNSSGNYVLGVGNLQVMPLFNFFASNDPSVAQTFGDPSVNAGAAVMAFPAGGAMAIVGTGPYELISTAYVTSGSYPPNTFLTSATGTTGNAGLLNVGTIHTNMIVGIVSRGVVDNGYGTPALAFWPFPIFP